MNGSGCMKVWNFFILLLVLLCPDLSWGECKPVPCNTSSNNDRISTRTLDKKGSSREQNCYVCETGYCEAGDIVFLSDYTKFKICKQSVNWVGNDTWNEYLLTKCSQNHEIYSEDRVLDYSISNLTNTKKEYYVPDAKFYDYSGVFKRNDSISPCYYFVCNDGDVPSEDKTKCVSVAEKLSEQQCLESHGKEYVNEECVCEESKNLIQSSDNKTCVCKDKHTWNGEEGKCVHKDKQGCDDTGGSWDDANKNCLCNAENTEKKGNKCECKSSDYGWIDSNNKKQGCSLKDSAKQRQACEDAKGKGQDVKWDGSSCKCVNDTGNKLKFEDGKCVEKSEYTQCNKLGNDAEWNAATGECRCKDENKEVVSGRCEYTPSYKDKKAQEEKAATQAAARAGIDNIAKDLDAVVATFDRSKWRDADGNFNTARLASDSVAAVVLGTAGGLISSKVIKKKQVENGFEDIKCTIGDQEVADWGDEFQVGIQ